MKTQDQEKEDWCHYSNLPSPLAYIKSEEDKTEISNDKLE